MILVFKTSYFCHGQLINVDMAGNLVQYCSLSCPLSPFSCLHFPYTQLEVRMATADQTIPSISVDLPGTSSSYRQCDLKPSSLYIVTIMALDSGQEVITSITSTFSTGERTRLQCCPKLFQVSCASLLNKPTKFKIVQYCMTMFYFIV